MESKCNSNPSTPGRMSLDQRRDQDEEVKKGAKEKKKGRGKRKRKRKRKRPDILIPRSSISQSCFFSHFLFSFSTSPTLTFSLATPIHPSSIRPCVHHPIISVCLSVFLSFFSFFFFSFYFLFFILCFLLKRPPSISIEQQAKLVE